MVVALEYAFFQLCSNVKQISVRLARLRRSYLKRPAVVLTSHTSFTVFLLHARCTVESDHVPFLQLFAPVDNVFAETIFVEHTSCLNVANSRMGKQIKRRKYVK